MGNGDWHNAVNLPKDITSTLDSINYQVSL